MPRLERSESAQTAYNAELNSPSSVETVAEAFAVIGLPKYAPLQPLDAGRRRERAEQPVLHDSDRSETRRLRGD